MSTWRNRERKEKAQKERMIVHGGSMKRILNDLENRVKYHSVRPGIDFVDEKHNRDLTVVQVCEVDPSFWYCRTSVCNVLYRYKDTFILENKI